MKLDIVMAHRRALRAAAVLAVLAAVVHPVQAQARFSTQVGVSWGDYPAVLNIRGWIPTLAHVDVLASAGVSFRALRDVAPDVSIDAARSFRLPDVASQPYLGVGFGWSRYPVTYQPEWYALNVFGGTRLEPRAGAATFLELRLKLRAGGNTTQPGTRVVMTMGLLF